MTAECLTAIFNASLRKSELPREWKMAHVAPLHKKGSTDQPNNYRPISLTSIPCKLLEHIVLHHHSDEDYHVKHNYVPLIMKLHGMQIKVVPFML